MRGRIGITLLAIAALALPTLGSAQAGKSGPRIVRYTDQNGQVRFSDSVPPEDAGFDRTILNQQGVPVGFEEGEITPEERAAMEAREAAEQAERQAKADVARRDRMLLETYLSVKDIEDLRDRRLELLESQIAVTERFLTNLRKRLVGLQDEASAFKPYTTRSDAPQIPNDLALDISRTASNINVYEQTLARTREDQESLRNSFNRDIARFKELKGG